MVEKYNFIPNFQMLVYCLGMTALAAAENGLDETIVSRDLYYFVETNSLTWLDDNLVCDLQS